MLHNKRRKSKGENHRHFKILTARNDASTRGGFPGTTEFIFHLSFAIFRLLLFQLVEALPDGARTK